MTLNGEVVPMMNPVFVPTANSEASKLYEKDSTRVFVPSLLSSIEIDNIN